MIVVHGDLKSDVTRPFSKERTRSMVRLRADQDHFVTQSEASAWFERLQVESGENDVVTNSGWFEAQHAGHLGRDTRDLPAGNHLALPPRFFRVVTRETDAVPDMHAVHQPVYPWSRLFDELRNDAMGPKLQRSQRSNKGIDHRCGVLSHDV